jgi:hypothetical protein
MPSNVTPLCKERKTPQHFAGGEWFDGWASWCDLVELRYFAGLTGDQAAQILGISPKQPTVTGFTPAPGYAAKWKAATPSDEIKKISDAGDALSSH